MTASNIIREKLQMLPHPEGGFYKETYRSQMVMNTETGSKRNVCTAIYYLLENNDRSHFHRILSDEIWYFHQGEVLEILVIINGRLQHILLGNDLANGQTPQAVIPAGCWFASHVAGEDGFALVSCSVAPGFDFADFEMARQEDLLAEYPALSDTIRRFTR